MPPSTSNAAKLPPPVQRHQIGTILSPLDFIPLGDGSFKATPRKPVELVNVSVAAKMTGVKRDALYKLYQAGFIKGTQASPRKILIYLASLLEHMEKASDPEFWTEVRRTRYFSGVP